MRLTYLGAQLTYLGDFLIFGLDDSVTYVLHNVRFRPGHEFAVKRANS